MAFYTFAFLTKYNIVNCGHWRLSAGGMVVWAGCLSLLGVAEERLHGVMESPGDRVELSYLCQSSPVGSFTSHTGRRPGLIGLWGHALAEVGLQVLPSSADMCHIYIFILVYEYPRCPDSRYFWMFSLCNTDVLSRDWYGFIAKMWKCLLYSLLGGTECCSHRYPLCVIKRVLLIACRKACRHTLLT